MIDFILRLLKLRPTKADEKIPVLVNSVWRHRSGGTDCTVREVSEGRVFFSNGLGDVDLDEEVFRTVYYQVKV